MEIRKSPEQWLEKAEPPEKKEGVLKLFLGYAPGVGKTFTMLSEAIRRHTRGEDVVIGYVETHSRPPIRELAAQVPVVPRRKLEYKGIQFEEMDVDAIMARHPQVAVVDELAHTNIEGSRHGKRYEDVMDLLAAKIDVLSTLNIQHVDSLAPQVQSITGVPVRETVPDWLLKKAGEVVMIDLTPEALRNRMRRGDIYPVDRAERALGNFFRGGNLIALRELALRRVAESVDLSLESYLETKNITRNWGVRERIAVCISSDPSSQYLIARAARIARAIDGELYALYVDTGEDNDDEQKQRNLEANIRFAGGLEAQVERLKGRSVAEAAIEFVKEKRITQVVFGHSTSAGWRKYLYLSAVHRFLRDAPSVDVHIVTQEGGLDA
ncbi:MAG TPA: universal stress protein [Terriglobia bacterium]|nr:universal stress protein [Terriglobia bacterium]